MLIRDIIEIDENKCTGCGLCVIACAEGAIEISDGKARVVRDIFCDGLGACLGHCPEGALRIVERSAEPFDEAAAKEHARSINSPKNKRKSPVRNCPGTAPAVFRTGRPTMPGQPLGNNASSLGHWPVKIRLMPVDSQIMNGADLVIAADCTAVAHPNFHRRFTPGAVVLIGCPKFDVDADYADRFALMFSKVKPKSVTVVSMEVPCCDGLPYAVKRGLAVAGTDVPYGEIVVGRQGEAAESGPCPSAGIPARS